MAGHAAVSADANGGEGADLVLGQRDVHHVALDPGDGPDRDGDLLPSPQVSAFEDEVRDALVRVDQEPSTSPSEWPSAEITALARRTSTSPFGTRS